MYQSLLNRKVPDYRTPYRVPNWMQPEMTSIKKWNNTTHGHNNVWADHHHGYVSIKISTTSPKMDRD